MRYHRIRKGCGCRQRVKDQQEAAVRFRVSDRRASAQRRHDLRRAARGVAVGRSVVIILVDTNIWSLALLQLPEVAAQVRLAATRVRDLLDSLYPARVR